MEVEEDWGDATPVEVPDQPLIPQPIKFQGLREDKDISKEEEKGGGKIEDTEISIVTIAITSIKL